MFKISTGVTVIIEGCPDSGLEAVDFRRAAGLPEAPSNKIDLPTMEFTDEPFARKLHLNSECNYHLSSAAAKPWYCTASGITEQRHGGCYIISVLPADIRRYLEATGGDKHDAAKLLIASAIGFSARSKAAAEAEAKAMAPELEAKRLT